MLLALIVILLSAANIALAVMLAMLARQLRRTGDEVTELQAMVDVLLLAAGKGAYFAERYDLEYVKVLDPTTLPPPEE